MAFSGVLAFFGIGSAADADYLAQGKRRAVAWLSFLVFALYIGAVAGPNWVLSGVEFSDDGGNRNNLHVHVDLSTVGIERYFNDLYLNQQLASDVVYAREDYIARAITQSFWVNPGNGVCGIGANPISYSAGACVRDAVDSTCNYNIWCGVLSNSQKNMNADFNSVRGLLGFATFLSISAWLLMSAVYSRNNTILSIQKIYTVIAVFMGGAGFFAFVAVCVFAGAGIKDAFCTAFDPDSGFDGIYCGYSDGFGAAIAGVVLSVAQTALFWYWMPHDELADIPEKEGAIIPGSGGYSGFGASGGGNGAAAPAEPSEPFQGGFNSAL